MQNMHPQKQASRHTYLIILTVAFLSILIILGISQWYISSINDMEKKLDERQHNIETLYNKR